MVYKLNSSWVLWNHKSNDKNWDLNSYNNIYEFNDIESFWKLVNTIDKHYKNYSNDMIFLMRKNEDKIIYPMWEDKHNKNGGYWSFKIEKNILNKIWIDTMIYTIGEKILNKYDDNNIINGISISPKRNNCILKIWNNNYNYKDVKLLNKIENIDYNNVIYKCHNDNIKYDKNKLNRYSYVGRRQFI